MGEEGRVTFAVSNSMGLAIPSLLFR